MTSVQLLAGGAILFQKDRLRSVYVPGSDLTNAPERVRAMAEQFWTPQVIDAHMNRNTESHDGAGQGSA
jgi:hypothetical protein